MEETWMILIGIIFYKLSVLRIKSNAFIVPKFANILFSDVRKA
jgi:hypothetical protein